MTQVCENENCYNKNPDEPVYCCNAFDCECKGKPTPYFCSETCYQSYCTDVELATSECLKQFVTNPAPYLGNMLDGNAIVVTLTGQIKSKPQSVTIDFKLDEPE